MRREQAGSHNPSEMRGIRSMPEDDTKGTIIALDSDDYDRKARPASASAMKIVTVYRIDYLKKTRVPIGVVVERRKRDRGENLLGLLRVARKTYSSAAEDSIQIAIDVVGSK